MPTDFGSAADEFHELEGSLRLTSAARGCSELRDRVSTLGIVAPPMAESVLMALDRLAEAAEDDLRRADELRDRRLGRADEIFEQNAKASKEACDAAIRDADARLKLDRGEISDEDARLTRRLQTEQEALEAAQRMRDAVAQDRAQRRISSIRSEKEQLHHEEIAVEQRCARRKQAALDEKAGHDRENAEGRSRAREECQRLHDALVKRIAETAAAPVDALVPRDAYDQALSMEQAMRLDLRHLVMRDVEGYECPPYFLVGSVYVPTTRDADRGGGSVFGHVLPVAVGTAPDGARAVRLPLVCDLAEGLQIVFRPTRDDASMRQILRSLTLRLLLAYPPTTLNVALFDPRRNGETFAGLGAIVDLAHENVLPSIVVSADEIGARLESLRLRMAQHIANYGDPEEDGFFAHQAVQAIIINDFPYGFDARSLSELAKIMESGPKLGTIVILSLNAGFTTPFEDNDDLRSILSSKRVWLLSGRDNWFERAGSHLCVSIGETDEIEGDPAAEDAMVNALREGICGAQGRTLSFRDMIGPLADDPGRWLHESSRGGIEVPIGITGGNQRATVSVGQPGGRVHHGLVGGSTGAGKSTLLHTMIMSSLLAYSASEVQLVLIDFKEGDEFAPFARFELPSLRSVTVTTKPELALAALEDVSREWDYRASLRMDDYGTWRRDHPDEFMPRIVVIFDEVQEILSDRTTPEAIRARCLDIIAHLSRQGRSHGIHLFLASQSFGRLGPIMELSDNMQCRIALQTDTGLLEDDGALSNAQRGAAVVNEHGGAGDGNQLIQVALLGREDEARLLERLQGLYADPRLRASVAEAATLLYYSSLADNPRHPFNRLVAGEAPRRYEGTCPQVVPGLILSEPGMEDAYELTGEPCEVPLRRNLLLVSGDVSVASRVLVNLALSLSTDDLARQAGGLYASDRVVVASFLARRRRAAARRDEEGRQVAVADLDALPCVERVPGVVTLDAWGERTPFERAVGELHQMLRERRATGFDGRGCVVLVIWGLGAAGQAMAADVQALGGVGEPTLLEKVQGLIHDGPDLGIQTVVWASSLDEVGRVLGRGNRAVTLREFGARLAYGSSGDELLGLTGLSTGPATPGALALYDGSDGSRLFVSPLNLTQSQPLEWLDRFAASCEKLRAARDGRGPSPW